MFYHFITQNSGCVTTLHYTVYAAALRCTVLYRVSQPSRSWQQPLNPKLFTLAALSKIAKRTRATNKINEALAKPSQPWQRYTPAKITSIMNANTIRVRFIKPTQKGLLPSESSVLVLNVSCQMLRILEFGAAVRTLLFGITLSPHFPSSSHMLQFAFKLHPKNEPLYLKLF